MGKKIAQETFPPRAMVRVGSYVNTALPTCKTNVKKLLAHKVPEYQLAVIIILSYLPRSNEWVHE